MELLEKVIERELSSFEKQVLDLHLTGMTYSQIARVLGRDDKSTDNALQRIKTKLRKAIKNRASARSIQRMLRILLQWLTLSHFPIE